eukprot:TRINITY_DN7786_c0_g1_i2.p2 TRINITY_DN7786_c0_g1~~TRINITY_DN7786_c0_g1_i2.p2  ORF type:complete len:158 (-),score=0.80 TRINITY_DN7786_c0_g1_i2:64-537(-)
MIQFKTDISNDELLKDFLLQHFYCIQTPQVPKVDVILNFYSICIFLFSLRWLHLQFLLQFFNKYSVTYLGKWLFVLLCALLVLNISGFFWFFFFFFKEGYRQVQEQLQKTHLENIYERFELLNLCMVGVFASIIMEVYTVDSLQSEILGPKNFALNQ